jgi:hypothetical protein
MPNSGLLEPVVVLREEDVVDWLVLAVAAPVRVCLEPGEEVSLVFAAFLASFAALGETQVTVGEM